MFGFWSALTKDRYVFYLLVRLGIELSEFLVCCCSYLSFLIDAMLLSPQLILIESLMVDLLLPGEKMCVIWLLSIRCLPLSI